MGCTVHNIRGFAHKNSGGQSLVFPDVCKTGAPPAGPIPIPYPNLGKSSDTSDGTTTVEADGAMVMVKRPSTRRVISTNPARPGASSATRCRMCAST